MSFPPEPVAGVHRRDLLALTLTVPLAVVGSVVAPLRHTLPAAIPAPALPAPPPDIARGYHSSAHIDTYYSSLRY